MSVQSENSDKAKKPLVFGLDEFGLSIAQLSSLGGVKIKVRMHLRCINAKLLFKSKASQRIEKMKRHCELLFSRVKKKWSGGPLDVSWTGDQTRGFSASVGSTGLSRLLRMPEIGSIWLEEIPGRKRAILKPKDRWFAVKARFAVQIEKQTTGLQTYEDRIVIVKAISVEEAKKKLRPEFKRYGTPYLNSDGFMVRWAFESFLDFYEILEEKIETQGLEIFSVLGERRMKPKYAWQPNRKKDLYSP